MSKSNILLLVMIIAMFSVASFAQQTTPIAAVRSFYAYDRTHSQVFTRAAIDARRKWFSEALYKLFLNELKREKEYLRKNPNDKPYFGDGLPFQPYDETCKAGRRSLHKAVTFKTDTTVEKESRVKATFAFPKPCTDPDATTYMLQLVRSRAGWVIDNVIYENDSNLVNDLKRKDY